MNTIGNNFEGINVAPANSHKTESKKNDNQLENFQNVEWKNKNDGKTYVAKKITLKQNGKELTGIFVFDKTAKPDEQGNIKGEFMNFDAFMKKLTEELPSVNSSTAQSYFPNINHTNKSAGNKTVSVNPGLEFEDTFKNSLKLSDGSMIIKPDLAGVSNNITKGEDGKYYLTSMAVVMGAEPHTREITEDEILNPKYGLCAGTIKELDNGNYEVTYFGDAYTKESTEVMNSSECAKFLKENFLYSYKNQ